MKKYTITNQRDLRRAFWQSGNYNKRRYKGDYITDTRVAFYDFIDCLYRSGDISPELAQRATLK